MKLAKGFPASSDAFSKVTVFSKRRLIASDNLTFSSIDFPTPVLDNIFINFSGILTFSYRNQRSID